MILLRTILLLVGLAGITVFGFFSFSSILVGGIAFAGLVLGFLLRQQIVKGAEYYSHVITIGLFVYSIVLFLGDRLNVWFAGDDSEIVVADFGNANAFRRRDFNFGRHSERRMDDF